MNAPMRGGDRPLDTGLFDTGARRQLDIFDDVTSPQAQRALDQVEADLRGDLEARAPEAEVRVDMADGRGQRTAESVFREFDEDRNFLEILDLCGRPRT